MNSELLVPRLHDIKYDTKLSILHTLIKDEYGVEWIEPLVNNLTESISDYNPRTCKASRMDVIRHVILYGHRLSPRLFEPCRNLVKLLLKRFGIQGELDGDDPVDASDADYPLQVDLAIEWVKCGGQSQRLWYKAILNNDHEMIEQIINKNIKHLLPIFSYPKYMELETAAQLWKSGVFLDSATQWHFISSNILNTRQLPMIELIIKRNANAFPMGELYCAIAKNDVARVKQFPVDMYRSDKFLPVRIAIVYGSVDCLEFITSGRQDHFVDIYMFGWAIRHNQLSIAKWAAARVASGDQSKYCVSAIWDNFSVSEWKIVLTIAKEIKILVHPPSSFWYDSVDKVEFGQAQGWKVCTIATSMASTLTESLQIVLINDLVRLVCDYVTF